MKLKHIWLGIAFIFIIALTVACSGGESEESATDNEGGASGEEQNTDPVELDFVYTGDPAFRKAMDEVLASFSEEHPHIIINGESATDGSYDEYLRTKDATGEFPDLFEVSSPQEYYESDRLAVIPEEVASLVEEPVTFDGDPYALPRDAGALGYIYNKAFFEEHGLNEDPQTYEEFLSVMQEVKDLGETPIAVGGKDVWHMGFWVSHFLVNEVYKENTDFHVDIYNENASWTDPEPTKALTKLVDLFQSDLVSENWISTPDNQLSALVTSGKAIGFYSGPWMFAQLKEADPEFEIGYMDVPDDEGNTNMVITGVANGWAISKDVEDDEEKMAAITTFYKYFYDKDNYTPYLQTMGNMATTVEEINYEADPEHNQLMETYNNADKKITTIDGMRGENQIPASFRDYLYKSIQEWILNDADLSEEIPKVDAEWKRLADQE